MTSEAMRAEFEAFWLQTRGPKRARRELVRHPAQPQTYIADSANRHWVTFQASRSAPDALAAIEAARVEARAKALEEAAVLCESVRDQIATYHRTMPEGAHQCAGAIRSRAAASMPPDLAAGGREGVR